jgi:hypothetical protein
VCSSDLTGDAVELVAAGVGVLITPQSLARLHHRRDLTYRPASDVPESSVVLAWPEEETTEEVEAFIGIIRGRTANSTRGKAPEPAPEKRKPAQQHRKAAPKPTKPTKPKTAKRGRRR